MNWLPHFRPALRRTTWLMLASAALVFSAAAWAAPPSTGSVAVVIRLFGFDRLLDVSADMALKEADQDIWTSETRACVRKGMRESFDEVLSGVVTEALISEEHAQAWIAFGATPAGGKFVGFLQEGVLAIARGQTPPSMGDFKAKITNAEMEEIGAFLQTPAGVSIRSFGAMNVSQAQKEAVAVKVATSCGLPMPAVSPAAGG